MHFIPLKSIYELDPGDSIRSKATGIIYQVTAHYGERATAVRTADVSNPNEWEVLRKGFTIVETLPNSDIVAP